jgi:hypothetical protein
MNLDLDMQNIRLIVPFSLSNIFDRYFMTSHQRVAYSCLYDSEQDCVHR